MVCEAAMLRGNIDHGSVEMVLVIPFRRCVEYKVLSRRQPFEILQNTMTFKFTIHVYSIGKKYWTFTMFEFIQILNKIL